MVTPISSPNAHDTSISPVTRPRRSYGTCIAIHAPSAQVEGCVALPDQHESNGQHRHPLARRGKDGSGDRHAQADGHGPSSTQPIDDVADGW